MFYFTNRGHRLFISGATRQKQGVVRLWTAVLRGVSALGADALEKPHTLDRKSGLSYP